MKIQIALTVNESKRMIAKAVVFLPEIKNALEKGKILLIGPCYIFNLSIG